MALLNESQVSERGLAQENNQRKTEVLRESHSHSVLHFHNTSSKEPLRLEPEEVREQYQHEDSLDDNINPVQML